MDHDYLSPIIPEKLYMSGEPSSHPERLVEAGINVVVNLSEHEDHIDITSLADEYLHWPIEDGPLPDLRTLWRMVDWVVGAVENGRRVLVHCDAGLNRSGLVCALVVKDLLHLSGSAAVGHIRLHRDAYALCNDTFVEYIDTLKAQSV